MRALLDSNFDTYTIGELLAAMENMAYAEELWANYPQYAELFCDISLAASELDVKFCDLCRYLPSPPDCNETGFEVTTRILNYTPMDYLYAANSCVSTDSAEMARRDMESLATCTKKNLRTLVLRVFEFMAELQSLKATYKTLANLLIQLDYNNSNLFQ